MEERKRNGWKITAIWFIILFGLQTIGIVGITIYMINEINIDDDNLYECFYNICGDYEDYWYGDGVCACYSYTDEGYAIMEETIYMK